MGFLSTVAEHRGTWTGPYSLKDPALAELFGSGRRTLAGPVVNELTAFGVGAMYDGVNQISSDVAKLTLNLKIRRKDGGSEDYVESKLYDLLGTMPNPETTSMVFRKTVTQHALVYGNGYAEIVRDAVGRPAAFWIIHPRNVQPFYDEGSVGPAGNRDPLRYRVSAPGGEQRVLEVRDVVHIKGLSDDGVTGHGIVSAAREVLGLALGQVRFLSTFVGNGAKFGGVLASDTQDLDDEQKSEIQSQLEKFRLGGGNASKTLVLGMGFKYQQVGVNPVDAQMKELLDWLVSETARYLNLPLFKMKLATPGAVSYASVEMAALEYLVSCLQPWLVTWEQELSAKCIPQLERRRQFVYHNVRSMLRTSFKEQNEALSMLIANGSITRNEARRWLDMNRLDGDQGDLATVQGAQVPLNKLAELVESQIKKNSTPPPAPAPPTGPTNPDDDERATRAAAAAAEASEAYLQAHEARIAAEATTTATQAELEARRQSEEQALTRATTLEVLAAELRVQAEQSTARAAAADTAREAAEQELAAVTAARDEAQGRADAARADAEAAEQRCRQAEADAEVARTEQQASVTRAAEAEAALADATARAETAGTDREAIEAARLQAEQDLESARSALAAATSEQQRLAAAVTESTTAAADAVTRAEQAEQQRAESAARAEALEAQLAEAQAARHVPCPLCNDAGLPPERHMGDPLGQIPCTCPAGQKVAAEIEAQQAQSGRDAAVARLAESRQAEATRLSAVLSAHRSLIVDVVRRLVERETDRAKSRQQSPEKLRGWMSTFYVTFEDGFVEAVLPAVRVHMAWKQSKDDPRAFAQQMAAAHIAESKRQLEGMLGAEPDDLAVALAHVLRAWETDRPEKLADAILEDEIAYLRELERAS